MRQTLADYGLSAAALGAGVLAIRHYRGLEEARASAPIESMGHVTIIVPARNEEYRIRPLLTSLVALRYQDVEVLVVDDDSEDGTAALASQLGARVVRAGPLPPGWTGKCHACARGVAASQGAWLLFTDADTVHEPESLAVALGLAGSRGLGFVSLLARQHCLTLFENLMLPYAYFGYFVGATSNSFHPILNGQYILCRRDEYERVGGHAAVRDSVIEDVTLGRLAADRGARVALFRGERWVSVRMYDSPRALWQGFAKNAVRFIRLNPAGGIATGLAGLVFLTAPVRALRSCTWRRRALVALAPALELAMWRRELGLSAVGGLLYPVPALVFQGIALNSLWNALVPGRAKWKGRRY